MNKPNIPGIISEAKRSERERIIKLLEDELWKLPNGMPAGGKTYLSIEEAIALIKGENK